MKIEHFLYGMIDGKIVLYKTAGVTHILSDKNFQFLRALTATDSDKYWWLPTEQVVALPHIESVTDEDGRTWVLNHTLLMPIHDYLKLTDPNNFLSHLFITKPINPEKFETFTINVKEHGNKK